MVEAKQAFPMAYAVGTDPRELVNICLSQVGDIEADDYPLGFVYVSDALADELDHILHLLVHGSGISYWVGSLGIALCVTNKELYDQPVMAIMPVNIETSDFEIFDNIQEPEDTLNLRSDWVNRHAPFFGVIHGDATNPAAPEIIRRLETEIPTHHCFMTGGLTSSHKEQYQIADGVTKGGISGVLFSDRVRITTDHTQGCTPLDGSYSITSCQQNIIHRLDDRLAVDVLKEAVGEVLARDFSRLGGYIFAGMPVPGSDTHDYMVRNLIGIDASSGAIAIGEHVNEGDPLIFCRRDGNTAVEDMHAMLKRIKARIGDTKPRGGLYFTCLGRGRHLFGDHSEEMQQISQVLGDFPLIGFQANGEIFHNRLYGYTGVLVLFS